MNRVMLKILLILQVAFAANIYADSFNGFLVEQNSTMIDAADIVSWNTDVKPFSFCVISDLHGSEPAIKGYDQFGSAREKFALAVDHIANSGNEKPDFIIVCGDIHLNAIKDIVDKSGFKFHFIAGNHEKQQDREQLRLSYPDDFNIDGEQSDYYSFVHNECRFVGMCDTAYPEHVGHLSSEQIRPFGQSQWLSDQLQKKEKIKVVFGHIPPHPECEDVNMYMSQNDCKFFSDLVADMTPSLMFFGHQHQPTRQVMIGRSRCYILRSLSWNADNAPIGYLRVNFSKNGVSINEYTFKAGDDAQEVPEFSFGIVADVQYADRDDVPATKSYYRSAPKRLAEMVEQLNKQDLEFAVQLGDIIDSKYESYDTIWPIWNMVRAAKYNVVGNHDFVPAEVDAGVIYDKLSISPNGYYDFVRDNIRFIVLNTSDVSLYANKPESEQYKTAEKMLKELQQAGADGAHPWGGAIGQKQMQWLKGLLKQSQDEGKKVVIFSHHPLIPSALWNCGKVIDVINEFDCVVACIAGHIHEGYYAERQGVHYWTVQGMMADSVQTSYAIAHVYDDKIVIDGFGRESDQTLRFDD